MRDLVARLAGAIRVDAVWLAVEPVDVGAGMDTVLARVVAVLGAAHRHRAYVFTSADRFSCGSGVFPSSRDLFVIAY